MELEKVDFYTTHWSMQTRNEKQAIHWMSWWQTKKQSSQRRRKLEFWNFLSDACYPKIGKKWKRNWWIQRCFGVRWFWRIPKSIKTVGSFTLCSQIWCVILNSVFVEKKGNYFFLFNFQRKIGIAWFQTNVWASERFAFGWDVASDQRHSIQTIRNSDRQRKISRDTKGRRHL